jgi:hypothetical protein
LDSGCFIHIYMFAVIGQRSLFSLRNADDTLKVSHFPVLPHTSF